MQFTITHWGCTPSGDSIYLFRLTNATGASIEAYKPGSHLGFGQYAEPIRRL